MADTTAIKIKVAELSGAVEASDIDPKRKSTVEKLIDCISLELDVEDLG